MSSNRAKGSFTNLKITSRNHFCFGKRKPKNVLNDSNGLEIESEISLNILAKSKPKITKKGFKNNFTAEGENNSQNQNENNNKNFGYQRETEKNKSPSVHSKAATINAPQVDKNMYEEYYNNPYFYSYYTLEDYTGYETYYGNGQYYPYETKNYTPGQEYNYDEFKDDFRSLNIELLQAKISSFNLETENEALKNKIEVLNYYIGTLSTNNNNMNANANINGIGGNMYNLNNNSNGTTFNTNKYNYNNNMSNMNNNNMNLNMKTNDTNINMNNMINNNKNINTPMNNNNLNMNTNYTNTNLNNYNNNNFNNEILQNNLKTLSKTNNNIMNTNIELKEAIMEIDKEREHYIKLIKKLKLKVNSNLTIHISWKRKIFS